MTNEFRTFHCQNYQWWRQARLIFYVGGGIMPMDPVEAAQTATNSYLIICSIITSTAAVVAIIITLIRFMKSPNTRQDERLSGLEGRMDCVEKHIDSDNKRLQIIEEGNRVTQRALLALLSHALDGNDTDELKNAKDKLKEYLVNK